MAARYFVRGYIFLSRSPLVATCYPHSELCLAFTAGNVLRHRLWVILFKTGPRQQIIAHGWRPPVAQRSILPDWSLCGREYCLFRVDLSSAYVVAEQGTPIIMSPDTRWRSMKTQFNCRTPIRVGINDSICTIIRSLFRGIILLKPKDRELAGLSLVVEVRYNTIYLLCVPEDH